MLTQARPSGQTRPPQSRILHWMLLVLCLPWLALPVAAGTLLVDPAAARQSPGASMDYIADPGRQHGPPGIAVDAFSSAG